MVELRGVSNICQVAIVVKSLDAAIEQYRTVLGISDFNVFYFDSRDIPGIIYRGKPADYRIKAAIAKLGSWEFEMVECLRGASIYREFLDKHGEGMQHLGMVVDDFDAAVAQLTEAGFTKVMYGPIPGKGGDGRFAYFETPGVFGGVLELLRYPDALDYPE
jgi:methylmalonyl-CoA/ethylmalonyl-CoA epimerase